jgi:hypothetical protein
VTATLSAGNDTWSAAIPDGTAAQVEFTLPTDDPYRLMWALPNRSVRGVFGIYERPDAMPAAMGSALSVTVTLPSPYASGQSFVLATVGAWAVHGFTAAELPAPDTGATTIGPVTLPYETPIFNSPVGRPLSRITTADRVLALRYVGDDLTASGEVTPFAQSAGTDAIAATLIANPHAPLDVTVEPTAVATRLNQPSPAGTNLSMGWSVHAAPAWQYAHLTGINLRSGSMAPSDPGTITAGYGNPFTGLGWNTILQWNTVKTRAFTEPASMLPVTLYSGHYDRVEPTAGLMLGQAAGLPVLVSINQTPLTSDGLSVTLDPARPVALSMATDRTTNTLYQYNVYELVPNASEPPTALVYKIVYVALGTSTDITIPNNVFTAGRVYTIRAHCIRGGYPMLGDGDLGVRALPYAVGYLDSGVFTVVAP